jgi:hypothetical protein
VIPRDVDYHYDGADNEEVTSLTVHDSSTPFAQYTYDAAGNQLTRCYGTYSAGIQTS